MMTNQSIKDSEEIQALKDEIKDLKKYKSWYEVEQARKREVSPREISGGLVAVDNINGYQLITGYVNEERYETFFRGHGYNHTVISSDKGDLAAAKLSHKNAIEYIKEKYLDKS